MDELTEFLNWILLKARLHENAAMPSVREGEIWWAAIGKNVGVEINGKNEKFSRPVLVFKKFGRQSIFALPLTSKPHDGNWYIPIKFRQKDSWVILVQARIISVNRLYSRMGMLSDYEFKKVQRGFNNIYCKKKFDPHRKMRGVAGNPDTKLILARIKDNVKNFLIRNVARKDAKIIK